MKSKILKAFNENRLIMYNKDDLAYENVPRSFFPKILFWYFGILIIAICISIRGGITIGEKTAKEEILKNLSTYEKLSIIVEADVFTEEKFIEMLINLNVKFPHIVMAQAIVESGLGTSVLYKTNYNLLGMKEALIRPNHHNGSANGHALYNSWRESVYDYLYWQLYTGGARLKTDDEYYVFLKEAKYAEKENYAETVKSVVEQRKLKEVFYK